MSAEIIPLTKPGYTVVWVTPDEKRILECYRAASEEGKRKIMAMIKLLGFVRRRLVAEIELTVPPDQPHQPRRGSLRRGILCVKKTDESR